MHQFFQRLCLHISLFLIPLSCALPGNLANIGLISLSVSCLFLAGSLATQWKKHIISILFSLIFILFLLYITVAFGSAELKSLYDLGLIQFSLTIIFLTIIVTDKKIDSNSRQWLHYGIYAAIILTFVSGILQNFGIIPTTKPSIGFYEKGSPFYRVTGLLPHASMYSLASIALANAALFFSNRLTTIIISTIALTGSFASILFAGGRASFLISCTLVILYTIWSSKKFNLREKILTLTFASLLALPFLYFLKSHNPSLYRLLGKHEFQSTHQQRLSEFDLALDMIAEKPTGYGLHGSAIAGKKYLKKTSQVSSWEFKEWRGIHNYYLALTLWWGIPGVLFYLFFTCAPLIYSIYKKNVSGGVFAIFFSGSYLIYAISDSTLYPEVASAIALISFLPYLARPSINLKKSKLRPIIIVASFCIALLITSAKSFIVKLTTIYSYHIDNPSKNITWKLKYNHNEILIPPDGHFTIHRSQPMKPLIIENNLGHKEKITHEMNSPEQPWNRFLVTLEPDSEAYYLETFEFMERPDRMELITFPLKIPAFIPYPFPKNHSDRIREFLEGPPPNYKLAFKKTSQGVQSSLETRLIRSSKNQRLPNQCWEPIGSIYGSEELGRETCSANKHWNSYGINVYRNLIKFIKSTYL